MTNLCEYEFEPNPETVTPENNESVLEKWSCQRQSYGGTECCIFHLSPNERNELGLSQDDIRAAVRRLPDREGIGNKQLIGAEFEDLDLSMLVIDGKDKRPLDFRHITVEGTLSLERAQIQQPLDFTGANIENINLQNATFVESIDLNGSVISAELDASGAVFEDRVDMEEVQFEGMANFDEARFYGDVCLRSTEFHDEASFLGVEFRGEANLIDDDACFENAVFHQSTSFRKAEFRYADFANAVFSKSANFDEAIFTGDAEFHEASFNAGGSFRGTEFQGDANVLIDDADFSAVKFGDSANFEHAVFEYVNFEDAEFQDTADFHHAEFNDSAVFRAATVNGEIDFTEARFHEDADFGMATFEAMSYFLGVEFEGGDNLENDDVNFANANFESGADFEAGVLGYANFESVLFSGRVGFKMADFNSDANFKSATIKGAATFDEARFIGDTTFRNAVLEADASFKGVEFRGEANVAQDDLTFAGATFEGDADFEGGIFRYASFNEVTVAGDTNFNNAVFKRDLNCSGTDFQGQVDFNEARFRSDVDFTEVKIDGPAKFNGAEFEGGDNLEDDDITFRGADFSNRAEFELAEFGYADFTDSDFYGPAIFQNAKFNEDVYFDSASFSGRIDLNETRFREDASFESVVFHGEVCLRGAEFRGGDNVEEEDVRFVESVFHKPSDFSSSKFRYANFSEVTFNDAASFSDASFDGQSYFSSASFHGPVQFTEARFRDDASFESTIFDGDTKVDFSGVEFQGGAHVKEDDVTFMDAHFDAPVTFNLSHFRGANFTRARFTHTVSFEAAVFERQTIFENAVFEAGSNFTELNFEGEANFEGVTFGKQAEFIHANFEGGNSEDDDAGFNRAIFQADACFQRVDFGTAGFDEVTIEGDAKFTRGTFDRFRMKKAQLNGAVDFSFGDYNGKVIFEETAFGSDAGFDEIYFGSDVSFKASRFTERASFRGTEFTGGAHTVEDADFTDVKFGGPADFTHGSFRSVSFQQAELDGTFLFVDVDVRDRADFSQSVFRADARFTDSRFQQAIDLTEIQFNQEANFRRVVFEEEVTFESSLFDDVAYFESADFRAKSNEDKDDANFEKTLFRKKADFSNTTFFYANFRRTAIGATLSLENATVEEELFIRPETLDQDRALVDFGGGIVRGGTIGQPEVGDIFYDFTGGEINDVSLDHRNCSYPLFDHFRFCNTNFDGFDFSSHKSHLAENNWVIHEFAGEGELLPEDEAAKITNPATLENTYTKAKQSASQFGDRKAASEFFIREMVYRRKKNWKIATGHNVAENTNIATYGSENKFVPFDIDDGSEVDSLTRLKSYGRWAGNMVLYQTCGYGERLWRIVYISGVAITFWAILYTLLASITDSTGSAISGTNNPASIDGLLAIGQNIYFSTATFITLEYVGSPGNTLIRWIASLEAYFGALLIALVVFVLGRRVAW